MSVRPELVPDALSNILRRLRLRAEIFAHPEFCGAWAVDTSGHRKAAFHLIERGTGWLHTEAESQPRPLNSGDFILFPHDTRHVIASSAETPPASLQRNSRDS